MRSIIRSLVCVAAVATLAACAHDGRQGHITSVTPVSEVKLPQTVRIAGKVAAKKTTSFILRDNSGKIVVDTDSAKAVKLLKVGETVAVDGVLDEDPEMLHARKKGLKEFDAFIIHRADGTAIQLVKMEKQYQQQNSYRGKNVKKAVKAEAKKEIVREVQKH